MDKASSDEEGSGGETVEKRGAIPMRTKRGFVSALVVTAVAVVVGGAALAQLSADDRRCSDKVNNDARKVIAAEGKGNWRTCVDAGSGDISACVSAVQSGSAAGKLSADFAAKCGTLPVFGVNASDAAINGAAQDATDRIIKDVFGTPPAGIVAGNKCQDKMSQRPYQLAVAEWKAFRRCMKDLAAINTIADVEGCISSGIATGETAKGQRVNDDAAGKCTTYPPAGELGGACTTAADATALGSCIRDHVDCEVCLGLNTATGAAADCTTISGIPCGPTCPLAAGTYTVTQVAGGTLNLFILAGFPFPAGGSIVEDVHAASLPNCVHDLVVPFPNGFAAPNFCVPALNLIASVTQTGCGIGKLDSNGGSDFDTNEIADTSDSTTCLNVPATCGTPDTKIRVDITVGNGSADTCGAIVGGMNALVSVPVHTHIWADFSGGGFPSCPGSDGTTCCDGDGVFNGTDATTNDFDQILDFTTATAKGKWMDIDGNGCSLTTGSFGPAAGFTATGTCIDPSKVNTVSAAVTTVATGEFGSTGFGFDGSFSTKLPNTISGPGAPLGATCGSPPLVPPSGSTATRCIP